MKIVSVEISSFGKLNGFNHQFDSGVNVVGQNNSFGKTTLATFVRAMLYGLDYRKQNSPYYYKNYQPWGNDGRFGGSMTVEHNGTQYRIERYFSVGKSGQLLKVIDLSTGRTVDTDCPGELFLGLTATSYEQSVYIPQETVTVANNENFEQKLSGMMQGDKQDNNYDKAVERLRNYMKELRAERGRGGTINMLDEQLQQCELRIRELKGQEIAQQQWKERDKQIAVRLNELNMQQSKLNGQLASLRAEALSAQRTTDNSHMEQVRTAKEYMATHDIQRIISDRRMLESIVALSHTAHTNNKPSGFLIAGILLAVVAVVLAVVFAVLQLYVYIAIAGGVLLMSVVLLVLGRRDKPNKAKYSLDEQFVSRARTTYNVPSGSVADLLDAVSREESKYNSCRTIVEVFGAAATQADRHTDQLATMERDIATLNAQLDSMLQERDRLLRESGDLKGRIQNADSQNDSVVVADKIEQLKAAIKQAEYKYNVASLARTLLDQARVQLSTAYIPRLANLSSRLMDKATGGQLASVNVDNTFDVSITEQGQTHSINEYSRGVRELAAFCFRVALSSTVFGGNVPLLIVDDAFVNLDEQRFDSACKLLLSMARQGTQIIYMTCHQRSNRVFAKSID